MAYKFAFVMDPLEAVMPDKDTTFAFLRAGQQPVPVEGTGGMMLMGTLVVAVPIWFLVRRRTAFRNS